MIKIVTRLTKFWINVKKLVYVFDFTCTFIFSLIILLSDRNFFSFCGSDRLLVVN